MKIRIKRPGWAPLTRYTCGLEPKMGDVVDVPEGFWVRYPFVGDPVVEEKAPDAPPENKMVSSPVEKKGHARRSSRNQKLSRR
jgi:hypothetical protein